MTSWGCGNDSRNPISARYNSVLARGDIVLAESNFAAALAAKHFPAAAEKIRVLRRGIDCQVFAQDAVAPERVEAIRRQWQAAPHARPFCPQQAFSACNRALAEQHHSAARVCAKILGVYASLRRAGEK